MATKSGHNEVSDTLFRRYSAATTRAERERCEELLVSHHMGIAKSVALPFVRRYQRHADDLLQQANFELLKAIRRFDITRGFEFASFATPTIRGGLKRYLRDRLHLVKMPRRFSDMMGIRNAADVLAMELRRYPTDAELAERVGLTVEEVREFMQLAEKAGDATTDFSGPLGEFDHDSRLSTNEPGFERYEDSELLRNTLAVLPEREKYILVRCDLEDATQSEVAAALGVSQMQVSRLRTRAHEWMRQIIETGKTPPDLVARRDGVTHFRREIAEHSYREASARDIPVTQLYFMRRCDVSHSELTAILDGRIDDARWVKAILVTEAMRGLVSDRAIAQVQGYWTNNVRVSQDDIEELFRALKRTSLDVEPDEILDRVGIPKTEDLLQLPPLSFDMSAFEVLPELVRG